MNKLVVLVIASAVLLSVGVCVAAESEHLSIGRKATMVDRNSDGKTDGVDIYDETGKMVEKGYDTNNNMKVDRWETTDQNTGLPIVVASDESFLLE